MGFSEADRKAREEALKMKELRSAQGEFQAAQAEKAAFRAGAEKSGGFLGIGGSYASKKGGGGISTQQKVQMGTQIAGALGLGGGGSSSGGSQTTDTTDGAVGGALEGGMAGAMTGNPYAAVGMAAVGAITGGMKASEARKQKLAQIESERILAEGKANAEMEAKKQEIFGKIGAGFQSSLLRKV